ncbi:MAG: hypothetical protein JST92_22500, partial [Deltaproteobacteria bacterium]|nr:hypothetical protein [Deltaproteobacteria bacterium]
MNRRTPSFFMLVPGPWRDAVEVTRALSARGIPPEGKTGPGSFKIQIIEDDALAAAFAWGRHGPLAKELIARVGECSRAALIEFSGLLHEQAASVANLGRALRDAGGVAIRMEASGAASAWEPWLERMQSRRASSIYESAVLLIHDDEGVVFTCGMHQFDLPEAQIAMSDARDAMGWLDT